MVSLRMNNNSLPSGCVFCFKLKFWGGVLLLSLPFTWTGMNNPLYNNVALYK